MINYIFLICSLALIIVNAQFVLILKSKHKKITSALKFQLYFNYVIALISFIIGILLVLGGK